MCDENVIRLEGELEGLRARKAVLFCFYEQQGSVAEPSELDTTAPQGSAQTARLKHKLRVQKKQTNFLRVKLGTEQSLQQLKPLQPSV